MAAATNGGRAAADLPERLRRYDRLDSTSCPWAGASPCGGEVKGAGPNTISQVEVVGDDPAIGLRQAEPENPAPGGILVVGGPVAGVRAPGAGLGPCPLSVRRRTTRPGSAL